MPGEAGQENKTVWNLLSESHTISEEDFGLRKVCRLEGFSLFLSWYQVPRLPHPSEDCRYPAKQEATWSPLTRKGNKRRFPNLLAFHVKLKKLGNTHSALRGAGCRHDTLLERTQSTNIQGPLWEETQQADSTSGGGSWWHGRGGGDSTSPNMLWDHVNTFLQIHKTLNR